MIFNIFDFFFKIADFRLVKNVTCSILSPIDIWTLDFTAMLSWKLIDGGTDGWATSCVCRQNACCTGWWGHWANVVGHPTSRAACSWTPHCSWTSSPCAPLIGLYGHEMAAHFIPYRKAPRGRYSTYHHHCFYEPPASNCSELVIPVDEHNIITEVTYRVQDYCTSCKN